MLQSQKTCKFTWTNRKVASLTLTLCLVFSLFSVCVVSYAESIGNQKYPTAYNSGGPSGAYDYLVFTFENASGTFYAAKDSFGRIIDSWTSTNDDNVFGNVTAVTNASVVVAAGAYSATIEVPDGMQLTLNKGVTGVTYTVDVAASCVINDYSNGLNYVFDEGAIVGGNKMVTATIENMRYGYDSQASNINASSFTRSIFPNVIGYINDVYRSNLYYMPIVADCTNYEIYFINSANQLTFLTTYDESLGTITHAYATLYGRIIIYSSTMHKWLYYSSLANVAANTTITTIDSDPPLELNAALFTSTNRSDPDWYYFYWAEYNFSTPRPDELNVYRMNYDGDYTAVLTMNTSYIRHFHWIQMDPYNDGTIYVGSGDTAEETHIWRSTDYGDNWTEIANNSQIYRAVNVAFDEDYIYWATDSMISPITGEYDPECSYALIKSPKNDITNYEILFYYPDSSDIVSYGVTKTLNPSGLFTSMKTETSAEYTPELSVYWYSFADGYVRKVLELSTWREGPYVWGLSYAPPMQNIDTGLIYVRGSQLYFNDLAYANSNVDINAAHNYNPLISIRLTGNV